MTGEQFLDLIDEAVADLDRAKMAILSQLAFKFKDLDLQAVCRSVDNYIIFVQRGHTVAAAEGMKEVVRLVAKIRDKGEL